MSKLSDLLSGDDKNLADMTHEGKVNECLYRSDNSKRYEDQQTWIGLATVYAIMHLADVMKGKEG